MTYPEADGFYWVRIEGKYHDGRSYLSKWFPARFMTRFGPDWFVMMGDRLGSVAEWRGPIEEPAP